MYGHWAPKFSLPEERRYHRSVARAVGLNREVLFHCRAKLDVSLNNAGFDVRWPVLYAGGTFMHLGTITRSTILFMLK